MLSSAVLVLTAAIGVGHTETVSGNQHLSFFEPYVGTWTWSGALPEDMPFGKKGESGSGCLNWKWAYDKTAVDWEWKLDFGGKHLGTKGTMMWDAGQNKLVGAGVSSDGVLIRTTGRGTNPFTVYVESVGPDGKASSHVETFTLTSDDTLTIKNTERKGEPITADSCEYAFRRVKPTQQADGEKVFRSYAAMAIGGVWTSTIDGDNYEHSYSWMDGNKSIQLRGKGGVLPYFAVIGVDPETNQCTWWIFNENGSTGKSVMTRSPDGVWTTRGLGGGATGKIEYEGRLTPIDENTMKEEIIRFTIDGKNQGPPTATWNRKR